MTPQAAFEQLNRIAGIAPLGAPIITGSDLQLPTPLRATTASAAALGLGGAIAGEIWRFRGGERQAITIDLRAAAAALMPGSVLRLNGAPLVRRANPTDGFYQASDRRWIYMQGGPEAKARHMLVLLNAENDAASLLEAVAKWNSFALEDALAFMQQSGAVVRSADEWRASLPGRAVLSQPPIILRNIGEAPALRLSDNPMPLGDVRVLDLTHVVAGPAATRLLASYGADVLSVRAERLANHDAPDAGAGKRLAYLDLLKPADAEALRRLVRGCDIFVDSYRPGALARLGFSPAALAHIAPGIIHVAVSAYGAEGPWAELRGREEVVQAATGLAVEQGAFVAARRGSRRESLPALLPGAVLGTLTGYMAAAGAEAALLRRIREGGSWQVQVSLASTAMWLQSLGQIEARAVPAEFDPRTGLDPYLGSCEIGGDVLEFLGPVVKMSKTPPLRGAPPRRAEAPHWASSHEDANAPQAQPA